MCFGEVLDQTHHYLRTFPFLSSQMFLLSLHCWSFNKKETEQDIKLNNDIISLAFFLVNKIHSHIIKIK